MRVTTRGRYGLRAVLKLTLSDVGKPISIRELSEKEDISPAFLEQIFDSSRVLQCFLKVL